MKVGLYYQVFTKDYKDKLIYLQQENIYIIIYYFKLSFHCSQIIEIYVCLVFFSMIKYKIFVKLFFQQKSRNVQNVSNLM